MLIVYNFGFFKRQTPRKLMSDTGSDINFRYVGTRLVGWRSRACATRLTVTSGSAAESWLAAAESKDGYLVLTFYFYS